MARKKKKYRKVYRKGRPIKSKSLIKTALGTAASLIVLKKVADVI